jgi:hypothetical protein
METNYLKKPYVELKPCLLCKQMNDDHITVINRNVYHDRCLDNAWLTLHLHTSKNLKVQIIDNLLDNSADLLRLFTLMA